MKSVVRSMLESWANPTGGNFQNRRIILSVLFSLILLISCMFVLFALLYPDRGTNIILSLVILNMTIIVVLAVLVNRSDRQLEKNFHLLASREAALAESEAALRSIFDNSFDAILVSSKGLHQQVNPAYLRMFGYKHQGELIGKPIIDIISQGDRDRIEGYMRKRSAGEEAPSIVALKGVRKDGTVIEVEAHNSTYRVGNDVQIVVVLQDITERRRAEQELFESERALREANRKLSLALHTGHAGTFEWDANAEMLIWSSEIEENFGFPLGTFTGHPQTWTQYLITEDWQRAKEWMNLQVTRKAVDAAFEFRVITPAGETRWANAQGKCFYDPLGHLNRIVGIVTDITERKKTEEDLKSALEEKDVILRELYHRTKNNMQVISSLLQLQRAFIQDPSLVRVLDEMCNRIMSMSLVHQKLYQSKNLSQIDLSEYIRDLANLLLGSYRTNENISLDLELESVPVLIDTAIPLGLIINEIMSNALKYAFPEKIEGQISIALTRCEENMIHLAITDNGVGLPAGFDPRRDGKLGFQILFMLAEHQLQGKLSFRSEQGLAYSLLFDEALYNRRV